MRVTPSVGGCALLTAISAGWMAGAVGSGRAQEADLDIGRVRLRGATLVVAGSAGLAPVEQAIREHADEELRRAAPWLFADLDVAVLRYRDTRARVASVRFNRVADTHQLGVAIAVELHSARERRRITRHGLEWASDGSAHVATVTAEFRVIVAFDTSGLAVVSLRADRFTPTVHLEALRGASVSIPADHDLGRRVVALPERFSDLRATDGIVTDLRSNRVFFELSLVERTP